MAKFKKIQLTQGKYALVDNFDYEELSKYKWYAIKNNHSFYAARNIRISGKYRQRRVLMHRLIVNAPQGKVVDHRNGNGLDNRRSNLRVCTNGQNLQNRTNTTGVSQFKGVCWNEQMQKWRAYIKRVHLGYFNTEIEAAKAYDCQAEKLFGEFACLNFPKEQCCA